MAESTDCLTDGDDDGDDDGGDRCVCQLLSFGSPFIHEFYLSSGMPFCSRATDSRGLLSGRFISVCEGRSCLALIRQRLNSVNLLVRDRSVYSVEAERSRKTWEETVYCFLIMGREGEDHCVDPRHGDNRPDSSRPSDF